MPNQKLPGNVLKYPFESSKDHDATNKSYCINVHKGKAFPLQAWTGPWGSRRLRLQNF
jgi:hypothetical protein